MEKLSVRISKARSYNASVEELDRLSKDSDSRVREKVAMNPRTSEQTLIQMFADNNSHIRNLILMNPNLSLEFLLTLPREGKVALRLAEDKKTSSEILLELAQNEKASIRAAVARNINTPHEALVKLAKDENLAVLEAVSSNLCASAMIANEAITRYHTIDNMCLQLKAKNTSSSRLHEIARWVYEIARERRSSYILELLEHPNIGDETLRLIAEGASYEVMELILMHSATSTETLSMIREALEEAYFEDDNSRFSRNEAINLLTLIVMHPNVSSEILAKIAYATTSEIELLIVENDKVTAEIIDELYEDNSPENYLDFETSQELFYHIANCSKTSEKVLNALACNIDKFIRDLVKINPNSTEDIVAKAKRIDYMILHADILSTEEVDELFNIYKEYIQEDDYPAFEVLFSKLASNRNARTEVLVQLSKCSESIRVNAIDNPNFTSVILES